MTWQPFQNDTLKFCNDTQNSESQDMVLPCIEVKACIPARGCCNRRLQRYRLTQFSGAEVGSENCRYSTCALPCEPPRFGLLLCCRRFVQYGVRNCESEAIALPWERPEVFSDNETSSNRDYLPGSLYCWSVLPILCTAEGRYSCICGADFRLFDRVSVLLTVSKSRECNYGSVLLFHRYDRLSWRCIRSESDADQNEDKRSAVAVSMQNKVVVELSNSES